MDSEQTKRGALFVATGEKHYKEAISSVQSLKKQMPALNIVLWTEQERKDSSNLFSKIYILKKIEYSFADKIAPLLCSPFEKTIFLDTDTHICQPLYDLFELLDHWDFAAAHAPMRITWPQPDIPDSFPEVNSGVIAWR